MVGFGALWGTRVLQIVRRNDSPGLLWKKIKLTTTRKNNAKKRLRRVWQNEAVLRACAEEPAPNTSSGTTSSLKSSGQ
ncbi:uncharacterized protein LOC110107378 [Dendrobium catenatum]|uniref:Uncharacterized protein n=1 Tax=Dendrobium catenatum TaxID=906689 RepID=A0A2I0WFR5_9ASPA|nr:uncharacterized protein LOC110107378 [Dendrobium catenatum]PKU74505.1 hypothetical protein MA16_Dca003708 [Dendrobium catenatum]